MSLNNTCKVLQQTDESLYNRVCESFILYDAGFITSIVLLADISEVLDRFRPEIYKPLFEVYHTIRLEKLQERYDKLEQIARQTGA